MCKGLFIWKFEEKKGVVIEDIRYVNIVKPGTMTELE